MILNKESYFSKEAQDLYLGSSSFKAWDMDHEGGCEAREVAKSKGEWAEKENSAFLLGSYVHAWSEGSLQEFTINHPELFKKDGTLYAKYALGDEMINCLKNDYQVMQMLNAEKEKIMVGEISGIPFKIQVDVLNAKIGYFADIKTTKNIYEKYWNNKEKRWVSFIEKWDYPLQFAIYAEIIRQNLGSKEWLDSYVVAVDKQEVPNHEIIYMGTDFIEEKLEEIALKLPHIVSVRKGEIEPERCDKCEYCRKTKKVKKAIHYLKLLESEE